MPKLARWCSSPIKGFTIRPRDPCFPVSITIAGKKRSADGNSPNAPSVTITRNPICRNKSWTRDLTCQGHSMEKLHSSPEEHQGLGEPQPCRSQEKERNWLWLT